MPERGHRERRLLSVVVPAYREAGTIEEALHRLFDVLDVLERPVEVLVVSDGNTDGTEEAAARVTRPGLRVLHYPENRGKGFALCYGLAHSTGHLVAFIDADLDIHPEGILRFIEILEDTGVDVVVASKVHPESIISYPPLRRLQSRVFRTLVRTAFRLDIADTQTGLKLFRREVLELCLPQVKAEGFSFDLEMLVLANDAGFSIAEGPLQLDFQFSTTTGMPAVVHMLRDTGQLARRRRHGRRAGTWMSPAARASADVQRPETAQNG